MSFTPASSRIEQFLRQYPKRALHLVTGQVDLAGLAWLGTHTKGRPVRITLDWYANFSNTGMVSGFRRDSDHRAAAIEFLNRDDVSVWFWRRLQEGQEGNVWQNTHAKAFVVESRWPKRWPKAMLVGSANLTNKSLHHNFEMMAEASRSDHYMLAEMLGSVERESRRAEKSIRSLLPELGEPTEATLDPLRGPSGFRNLMWAKISFYLAAAWALLIVGFFMVWFLVKDVVTSL